MSNSAASISEPQAEFLPAAQIQASKQRSRQQAAPIKPEVANEAELERSGVRQKPSVDPNSAEHLLTSACLGQRIKRLRLKRSMGLVDLGKLTGLSASFLSQLETGRVVPTLRNLARISLVFGKDLSYFFETEDQSVFRVQRKRDRVRLNMGTPRTSYITESFGILVPEGGLRPCMAEFLPVSENEPFEPELYSGVEMVYVLDGTIGVDRNGHPHELKQHDLLYISGETTRSYRSLNNAPVRALIISFDEESTSMKRSKK